MRKKNRFLLFFILLLAFPLSSGIAQSYQTFNPDDVAAPFIGKPLPLLETKTLRGDIFKTTDYIGKGVLLHIWNFNCAYCYKELPELNLLAERYQGRGIKIVSLLVEDVDTALQRITVHDSFYQLKKKVFGNDQIHFEIVPVSTAQVALFTRQRIFPVEYVIDSKGAITYYSEGYYGSVGNPPTEETENYKFLKKKLNLIALN